MSNIALLSVSTLCTPCANNERLFTSKRPTGLSKILLQFFYPYTTDKCHGLH